MNCNVTLTFTSIFENVRCVIRVCYKFFQLKQNETKKKNYYIIETLRGKLYKFSVINSFIHSFIRLYNIITYKYTYTLIENQTEIIIMIIIIIFVMAL